MRSLLLAVLVAELSSICSLTSFCDLGSGVVLRLAMSDRTSSVATPDETVIIEKQGNTARLRAFRTQIWTNVRND